MIRNNTRFLHACTGVVACALWLCSLAPGVAAQRARRRPRSAASTHIKPSASDIAKRILPSVAMIVTDCGNGRVSVGSGFVVSYGLVATNKHVVDCGDDGYLTFVNQAEKHRILAKWFDPEHDLAILRVADVTASALPLFDNRNLAIGHTMYAAGNPRELEGTFSNGMVSSLRYAAGVIQFTAPISPGSSGGPVMDEYGRVIGMTVSSVENGQNLNFAVPTHFLQQLIGQVRRGQLAYNRTAAAAPEVATSRAPRPIPVDAVTPRVPPPPPPPPPARIVAEGETLYAAQPVVTPVYRRKEVDAQVEVITKPEPVYTREAMKVSGGGRVELQAVFGASGEVSDILVVKGLPDGLSWSAVQAARSIRFKPAIKGGKAVAVRLRLEYSFSVN